MVLKFNIDSIKKNANDFSCISYFKNQKYNLIIKKENKKKQIELPWLLSRLIPLQNFTFRPRSVLRLSINCKSENSISSDILFVDRQSYFKKQHENEGNWLSSTTESIYIFSNYLYDYFIENELNIEYLEIIQK